MAHAAHRRPSAVRASGIVVYHLGAVGVKKFFLKTVAGDIFHPFLYDMVWCRFFAALLDWIFFSLTGQIKRLAISTGKHLSLMPQQNLDIIRVFARQRMDFIVGNIEGEIALFRRFICRLSRLRHAHLSVFCRVLSVAVRHADTLWTLDICSHLDIFAL